MPKSYHEVIKTPSPKILCIGKNYLGHVKQMGGTEIPKQPTMFSKPWTSIAFNPQTLSLPICNQHRIDHQLELAVFISKGGSNIKKEDVHKHIGGYFIALDLTDRDFQKVAKEKGFPWTLAKEQDKFCPVSQLISADIDPYKVVLHLEVNGQTRQKDITANMHFKIGDMISYVSQYMSLTQGDMILTGTPQGVGPIKIGDLIHGTATIDGNVLAELKFKVTQ